MADVHDKQTRSYNMSRIRSKDTKPELAVRRFLHAHGFRYRLHVKKLQGKPDIVLHKYNTLIFVHGCFWHNHSNCKFARIPENNYDYWCAKLYKNAKRDNQHVVSLVKAGWKVIILWTCELRRDIGGITLNKVVSQLQENRL